VAEKIEKPEGKKKRAKQVRKPTEFVLTAQTRNADGMRVWTEVPLPENFAPEGKSRNRNAVAHAVYLELKTGGKNAPLYNGQTLDVHVSPGTFKFTAQVEKQVIETITVAEG
jgi:hypothetical protein